MSKGQAGQEYGPAPGAQAPPPGGMVTTPRTAQPMWSYLPTLHGGAVLSVALGLVKHGQAIDVDVPTRARGDHSMSLRGQIRRHFPQLSIRKVPASCRSGLVGPGHHPAGGLGVGALATRTSGMKHGMHEPQPSRRGHLMRAAVVRQFDHPPRYEGFAPPVPSDEHEELIDVLASGLHPRDRSQANGSH